MSRSNKVHPIYFFAAMFFLALLFSQTACSPTQREGVVHIGQALNEQVDKSLTEPNDLVFTGQISGENGRWLNDRVIVLFKNGEEIARAISGLRENSLSPNGPMDGVFELRTRNEYKLTNSNAFFYTNGTPIEMKLVSGMVGAAYIGTWFDGLRPGSLRVIQVPDKQLEYAVVVLSMPLHELPESHRQGNLRLEGQTLATTVPGRAGWHEGVAVQATAVPNPNPAPQATIQFTLLPTANSGVTWNLQMTGYYGNRWDVWERYLSGRVPGMSWEAFKEAVLVYNPHLESDGFVFYPEKMYRLPIHQ
jgi:hypothetical protein